MSKSLIPSFLVSDVSESLKLLTKNGANCSGRSPNKAMSEPPTLLQYERFEGEHSITSLGGVGGKE